MGSKAIRFSISKDEQGRTVRTHVPTGLKVVTTKTDRGTEFVFYAPRLDGKDVLGYWGEATTMSEMRWMAEGKVAELLVNIEVAYDEALVALADDIADTEAEVGPLNSEVVRQGIAAARRSLAAGFPGAAARRLNRVHNMINGTEPLPSDAEVAARLAIAETTHAIGTKVRDAYLRRDAVVESGPRVEAETGRVFVGLRFSKGETITRYVEEAEPELTDHARKQFPSVAAMLDDPTKQFPLFPVTPGTDDRRNAESGVEIVAQRFFNDPINGYEVRRPAPHKYGYVVVLHADTLGEAYDEACAQHYAIMGGIDVNTPHHDAEVVAADTDPEIAAEVAEANGLDAEDAAAMVTEAETRAILAAIPASARRGEVCTLIGKSLNAHTPAYARAFAEQARDLAAPKRLPLSVVRHASPVSFAPNATEKPADVPGATNVSPWKIDGTDTINRAPGGRIFVHVWQSYTDPEKGFSTRLFTAWLDELRTEGGASRVTLPGYPADR
jgi:hypothetical protein